LDGYPAADDLGQDLFRGRGPNEGLAYGVVRVEVFLDLCDEVGYRAEHTAAQGLVGQFPEPPLHQIQPGRRGRGEVQVEPWMLFQPGPHLRMFMVA